MKKAWNNIINYIVYGFCWLTCFSCVVFFTKQVQFLWNGTNLITYILSLLLLCVGAIVLYKMSKNKNMENLLASLFSCIEKYNSRKIFLFILFIPFCIRSLIQIIFPITVEGDIGVYIRLSQQIADNGFIVEHAEYSLQHPNLFFFGVFLVPASLLSHEYWAYSLYISLLMVVEGLMLYSAVSRISTRKIAGVCTLLYCYLPSQLFAHMAVTHEAGFQFFFILGLFIISKICKKDRIDTAFWLRWLLGILCFCLAKLINPMGVILIIALLLYFLFNKNSAITRIILVISTLLLVTVTTSISVPFQKALTEPVRDVATKNVLGWSLYTGANEKTEGRFSDDDLHYVNALIDQKLMENPELTVNEQNAFVMNLGINRWKDLLLRPIDLLSLLFKKYMNVWSGTHYTIEITEHYTDSHFKSYILLALVVINNIGYLLLMMITSIKYLQALKSQKWNDEIQFFKVFLCGIIAGLLLSEVMNKYNLTGLISTIMIISIVITNAANNEANCVPKGY